VVLILLPVMGMGCFSKDPHEETEEKQSATRVQTGKISVRTVRSKKQPFFSEILSNGVVHALQKADIRFPLNYPILSILIQNGQLVERGQLLATLDDSIIQHKRERTREALERSRVDLDDKLIDYGYRLSDSARIPPDILKMARIKAGYTNAGFDYRDALEELKGTRILAPFAGKVADLEARPYNSPDLYKKLCTLIDDRVLTVDFPALESEYRLLRIGQPVQARPYDDNSRVYRGVVTTINPAIDDNGMIHIAARIDNTGGYLLDGMNMHISLLTDEGEQLVIPREAVLEREGRNVIFTCENGLAKWNYVTLGKQNSQFQVVLSGLKPGEKVIVSNNINLAHGTELSPDEDSIPLHH
jgi:RND family efflux transporter MFP subunit